MENVITITMAATKANKMLVAEMMDVPGVQIVCGPPVEPAVPGTARATSKTKKPTASERKERDEMTIGAMAERLGINYYTARRWVVDQGKIPYFRPSGSPAGSIYLKKEDVERLAQGRSQKKKPGRATREVSII